MGLKWLRQKDCVREGVGFQPAISSEPVTGHFDQRSLLPEILEAKVLPEATSREKKLDSRPFSFVMKVVERFREKRLSA